MANLKVCLFGAAPDTGNRGVSALCYATLAGVGRRAQSAEITVFDSGLGLRRDSTPVDGAEFAFYRCGARFSKRLYMRESLWNIRWSARLGGLGNAGAKALRGAHAVLDLSGGDSFSDIYGARRFRSVMASKMTALERGTPLILLPQTYGPFRSERYKETAAKVVKSAAMAWARDARSFDTLRELAGEEFDPARHRSGVDVAFALDAIKPREPLPERLTQWIAASRRAPVVGFNVSGLLVHSAFAVGATERYGLKADYGDLVGSFLRRMLAQTEANIILVSHVYGDSDRGEADNVACERVAASLPAEAQERVLVLSQALDQSELKWVLGRLDWFCGTRMHATIAALSSGVPTSAIAYSDKTQGVFETCGQGACVCDPRKLSTQEAVDHLWTSWDGRARAAAALAESMPLVVRRAQEQMDVIVRACQEAANRRSGAASLVGGSPRPLRVLYSFPGRLGEPGIETIAWQQASQLVKLGLDVTIYAGGWEREVAGARRMVATMSKLGVRVPYRLVGLERALAHHDRVVARELLRNPERFDVVHTWPLAALCTLKAAHRMGVKSLLERPNAHTRTAYEIVECEMRRLGLTLPKAHSHSFNAKRLEREEAEYRLADRLLCPSEFVARTFTARGFPSDRLARHQYGFDPERFGTSRRAEREERNGLTVAFIGRCEPRKGLHFALEAWHASGAAEHGVFHICGQFVPGYREYLAKWLNHPSIREDGFVSDVGAILGQSDALVLPSIEEGSALVTYEARASGCLLLVSDAAGAPCDNGVHGLVHRAGDVEALAAHLRTVAMDGQLRRRLQRGAVAGLEMLTWRYAATRLSQVMGDLGAPPRGESGRQLEPV